MRQQYPLPLSSYCLTLSMADIEPPSFSLGLDFDLDSDLPCQAPDSPTLATSFDPPYDNNGSHRPGTGPIPDSQPDPPPLFRRLRRGPSTKTTESPLPSVGRESDHLLFDVDDDDIEEFSSDELGSRADEQSAAKFQSVCSGAKFSLHGRGIVTNQPSKEPCRKRKQDLDAPSTSSGAERGKPFFSEVARSPLRRFQLIDSDSDDMSSDPGDVVVLNSGIKHTKDSKSNAADGKRDPSDQFSKKVDFWKDFHPVEACNVATPVLDEFCKEYYRTPRDTKTGSDAPRGFCQTQRGEIERATTGAEKLQPADLGHALPPAHRYFFHEDPAIRGLVRSRLCHFQPLFPGNNAGSQQHNEIDYRSQFGQENSPSNQKGSIRGNSKTSSRKVGSNSKSSRGKRTTNSTEEWINPKSGGSIPKDASRRRIHASGGSAGLWHTDESGRKVYVNKSGQELTGQIAYRCYRKESGAGFGKSKKKRAARKKK